MLRALLSMVAAAALSCNAPRAGQAAQPASSACVRTGCSGHLCADEELMSTCEWQEQYGCYKTAACERQADGRCGWTMTPELKGCLERAGASSGDRPTPGPQ
jgi:eight-cysteine-cluster-containing protein